MEKCAGGRATKKIKNENNRNEKQLLLTQL